MNGQNPYQQRGVQPQGQGQVPMETITVKRPYQGGAATPGSQSNHPQSAGAAPQAPMGTNPMGQGGQINPGVLRALANEIARRRLMAQYMGQRGMM